MPFSKRRGINDAWFVAVLSVGAIILFIGVVAAFDSINNSAVTITTQTAGTITYYSVVDGAATIVVNTHSLGNQTVTCTLAPLHMKDTGSLGAIFIKVLLAQASDPSVILGLKVGDVVSIIHSFNGCNATILSR